MWDTVPTYRDHLSHDMPCQRCGHAMNTYLSCDATAPALRLSCPASASSLLPDAT